MYSRFIVIILIAALLIIFILQNSGGTSIKFLFWTIKMSKSLLAILCFILGFVFSSYTWIRAAKREKDKRRL
jgi:uncharacterized integral membrane protein